MIKSINKVKNRRHMNVYKLSLTVAAIEIAQILMTLPIIWIHSDYMRFRQKFFDLLLFFCTWTYLKQRCNNDSSSLQDFNTLLASRENDNNNGLNTSTTLIQKALVGNWEGRISEPLSFSVSLLLHLSLF